MASPWPDDNESRKRTMICQLCPPSIVLTLIERHICLPLDFPFQELSPIFHSGLPRIPFCHPVLIEARAESLCGHSPLTFFTDRRNIQCVCTHRSHFGRAVPADRRWTAQTESECYGFKNMTLTQQIAHKKKLPTVPPLQECCRSTQVIASPLVSLLGHGSYYWNTEATPLC